MRYILLFYLITLSLSFSFSQENKEIEISFFKGGKKIENVDYYLLKGRDAYLLEKRNNKIILNSRYFEENEKELKVLAKYKKYKVEFFIKPKEMHYLKITRIPFSIKYLFKKIYIINQGFDYEELVRESEEKYNFIK